MEKKPVLVYINPRSSKVKEFRISYFKLTFLAFSILLFSALLIKYSIDYIIDFSQNSRIAQLRKQNAILEAELNRMVEKMETMRAHLDELERMDDQVRAMLELPPISEDVRQVGVGGSEVDLKKTMELSGLPFGESLIKNLSLLERLEREIKLEKESYQKLVAVIERREDSLRYLPVLRPVPNSRITDGFGNRLHPILKRYRFHKGVDLAAPKGTPIIAPADGYVTFAGKNGGFGKFVQINHRYGFETFYGHMQKIYVRPGQFVKRGDKIGEVGNTGLSTNPHLHYEVHYRGKAVNPRDYFLPD